MIAGLHRQARVGGDPPCVSEGPTFIAAEMLGERFAHHDHGRTHQNDGWNAGWNDGWNDGWAVARSIRTRAAIIEAWLALINDGDLSPTARGVADRADVGLRTVFQHFSDMNALQLASAELHLARTTALAAEVSADQPLHERVIQITDNLGRVWESTTLLRRSCERQEWLSDSIHDFIAGWESIYSTSILQLFKAELDAMDADERDQIGLALDNLLSWSSWNHLRERRSLTVEQTREVLTLAVHSLLA